MRVLLLLMVGLCLSKVAAADEADEVAKQYYAACRDATNDRHETLKKRLPEMKRELAILKRSRINKNLRNTTTQGGITVFNSLKAKQDAIARHELAMANGESDLAKAEAGELFLYVDLPRPLAVGNVGKFGYLIEVVQKVNASSARVSVAGETCFFDGIDFSKIADGSDFKTDLTLEVTGTRTYNTVTGASRTEFVVKPFDLARLKPFGDDR